MAMTVIHGLSTNPTEKRTLALIVWVFSFFFVRFREAWFYETASLMLKNIIQHSPTNDIF
jgi:hypothetical protein